MLFEVFEEDEVRDNVVCLESDLYVGGDRCPFVELLCMCACIRSGDALTLSGLF